MAKSSEIRYLTPTNGKDARNKILFVGASRCTLQIRRNRTSRFIQMENNYYRKELDLGDGPSVSCLHPLLDRFLATFYALWSFQVSLFHVAWWRIGILE